MEVMRLGGTKREGRGGAPGWDEADRQNEPIDTHIGIEWSQEERNHIQYTKHSQHSCVH